MAEIVVTVVVELPNGSSYELTRRENVDDMPPTADVRARAATVATATVEVVRVGLGVGR